MFRKTGTTDQQVNGINHGLLLKNKNKKNFLFLIKQEEKATAGSGCSPQVKLIGAEGGVFRPLLYHLLE
ncbi:hypothetical protein EBT25_00320 [bacterium]|nr:hypothetical protein [bacterium]